MIVECPDLNHSRKYLDFGQGFYLTSIREQTIKYAQRFKRRGQSAWINSYELIDNLDKWNVKRFKSYDKDWLNFIVQCRDGKEVGNYDMVVGGIANDKVIITIEKFLMRKHLANLSP